jgi:integrase
MATHLNDAKIKSLPAPAHGSSITFDSRVAGFGLRVTSTGVKAFIYNYRTRAGRQRRFTIGQFPNWSTSAARTEAIRLRRLIDAGADPMGELQDARSAPTVAELADRFLEEHVSRKRPSTQTSYRRQIVNVIVPALGSLKVAEVTFAHVDRLHRKISERDAPIEANRVIAALSRMFTMSIRLHMRRDNPCELIERNQEEKRRRYLSVDELKRLTTALADYRDWQSAAIIALLLLTGARRGEALSARWENFAPGFTHWIKPGSTTKQRTEHRAPLNATARALLEDIRQRVPADSKWVFPVKGAAHRKDVKDAWHSICATAKIRGVRVHDLRHSFASILVNEGFDLSAIGALLGHSTPTTTHRYAHLRDDRLQEATERIGALVPLSIGRRHD